MENKDEIDKKFMTRAIELARRGEGNVSPNPLVGCVITRNGNIISEGYHQFCGSNHAEVNALIKIGNIDKLTLYVTLEPCCHEDKLTAPCADYIAKNKNIERVVIGCLDPNPKVQGLGVKKLKDAGIKVLVGVCEAECGKLIRIFQKNITKGTPFIHLKAAMSLDGRIANRENFSKWITDERARTWSHQLRKTNDATAVGRGTLESDNPGLDVRDVFSSRRKKRILFADISQMKKKIQSYQMFKQQAQSPTLIVTHSKNRATDRAKALQDLKIEIIFYEKSIFEIEVQKELFKKGVCSLLIEGGGDLISSAMKSSNFDELSLFIAPFVIGNGMSFFNDYDVKQISTMERLELSSSRKIEDQIMLNYLRKS